MPATFAFPSAPMTARARTRLMIVSNLSDAEIVRSYETYLNREGERPREP